MRLTSTILPHLRATLRLGLPVILVLLLPGTCSHLEVHTVHLLPMALLKRSMHLLLVHRGQVHLMALP